MRMWKKRAATSLSSDDSPRLRCSFCDKDQDEVHKLIAGPNVYICDECIAICNQVLAEERNPASLRLPDPDTIAQVSAVFCSLCTVPIDGAASIEVPERGALCSDCVRIIRKVLLGRS